MRRFIIGFVIVALLAFVVAQPYITAYRMKLAADAKDSDKLAEFIDFEALRESVRPQVQGRVAGETEGLSDDARVQAAIDAIGGAVAGGAVDKYVTPEGIAELMRRSEGSAGGESLEASAGYRALNRFAVELTDAENGRQVDLILTRQGLGWKLTEVHLPAD
ncbi:MAG: DUF2939 domain-containing protein [Gammaproteobacteria bacterium]